MSSDADQDKQQIRAEARRHLDALSDADMHALSIKACDRLAQTDFFRSALTVMLYLPTIGELDITPLGLRCFQLGKTVCAPRIDWEHRRMTPVEVRSFDDRFEVRRHDVREPAEGRPVLLEEIDLVVVPALAFDAAGARLGRGGGFYDRFLSQPALKSRTTRCGVGFDVQIIDHVPTAKHDARVDAIVTDRRLIRVVAVPKPA